MTIGSCQSGSVWSAAASTLRPKAPPFWIALTAFSPAAVG